METADDFDDRSPLLGNDAASNEHRPLYVIFEASNEQTPPEENSSFNGHWPLNGSCATSSRQISYSEQGTSALDTSPPCPNNSEETNEVSLEEVAQALCSAWKRNHKDDKSFINQDYFTTKELYAMHLAWKNVTKGRHCPFPAHRIAEAVAEAVAKQFGGPCPYPDHVNYLLYVTTDKCVLAVGLLREWKRIAEGVGFPVRYIETVVDNPDEPLPVSEFCRRQVELYDKVHDFIFCREFQCLLHLLLITWPISIIVVGSKYTECPRVYFQSYVLISLGFVGCLAILVRYALMYFMFYAEYSYDWLREWIGLRLIEFIFLLVFIVQAFHFFKTYPIAEPGAKKCVHNLYNAALVINCVSIPLVSIYVLVYFIIICANRFDFWRWIFRHF